MGFRKVALLTEIFALTAMSSVGFSSWLAIYSPSIQATGTVNVENITNQNDYMNINSMLFSEYNADGFYNDFVGGSETSKTATLYIELEVDLDKCQDVFGSYTKLDFDFELTTETKYFNHNNETKYFNLIIDADNRTLTYNYIIGTNKSTLSEIDITYSNQKILNSININGITSENITTDKKLFIYLNYKFDLTEDNFSKFTSFVQSNDERDTNGNITNQVDDEIKFKLVAVLQGGNS